jgi:hypothetical protein
MARATDQLGVGLDLLARHQALEDEVESTRGGVVGERSPERGSRCARAQRLALVEAVECLEHATFELIQRRGGEPAAPHPRRVAALAQLVENVCEHLLFEPDLALQLGLLRAAVA